MNERTFPGIGCAIVGALAGLPFAARRYEQANALSCCENRSAGAFLIGLFAVPICVVLLTPVMAGSSRLVAALPPPARMVAIVAIGGILGAFVGWALFNLTLLPTETGQDLSLLGVTPGALIGGGAALGWWLGAEVLGRKKVKNG